MLLGSFLQYAVYTQDAVYTHKELFKDARVSKYANIQGCASFKSWLKMYLIYPNLNLTDCDLELELVQVM